MRRLLVILGLLGVVMAPGVARAQEAGLRDPFDPLLTTGDETTTTTDTGDTSDTTDTTTSDGDTDPVPTDDLPSTGGDPRSWLALAYVLLVIGGGMLAYVRLTRRSSDLRRETVR